MHSGLINMCSRSDPSRMITFALTLILGSAVADAGPAPTRLAPEAHVHWNSVAREAQVDRIGVDLQLRRAGANPDHASVVAGGPLDRMRADTRQDPGVRIRWARMTDDTLLDARADGHAACDRLEGHDPVPGGREILVETTDKPTPATLVLASGAESELISVRLAPGETLVVVDVNHRRHGKSERIELRKGTETLSMSRDGQGVDVCYTDGAEGSGVDRAGWAELTRAPSPPPAPAQDGG